MFHELSISDLRHTWFDDNDGFMVSDWEIATAWDPRGRPTQWRRLRTEDPSDRGVLTHLLYAAAKATRGGPFRSCLPR